MKVLLILFVFLSCPTVCLYSQDKTIKGRVIAEDLGIVPFASIMIYDSVEIGKTDINGFFQIQIPISLNKLLFIFIGMEPTEISLPDTCDEVEVVMMLSGIYDFKTLRKVDRIRMKRFKNLPELHREAFSKGLFKTDRACFTQMFIPSYKRRK